MMEPGVALGAAAQVAVSLVGYTGVVVVFGRGAIHEWPPVDKFRLRLMLMFSVLPLVLSLFGLLVLAAGVTPEAAWRWCSGFAFVILVFFAVTSLTISRRPELRQLQSYGRATHFVFYLFGILGTGVTVFQLYNVVILGAFWPFFTGIAFQLTAAMFQFMRIILTPPE